jgi:NAD(P)-dependent dehydrogenase (short-subunit alcohol dehydrogenase family)
MMAVRFAGKVVLVAGGTGGLGRAVSLAFLEEGAQVVVTYRNRDEFARLQNVEGQRVNLTDEGAAQELITTILAKHKRLDAMVNTVGGYVGGTKLWESDLKVFDQMLAMNLRPSLILSRAVIPAMLEQKSGAIVNVASKAAVAHEAGAAAYASSKAGALALMDSLAEDLKGTGVRVNSVLPSIIDTEVNRRAMPKADFAKWPKPEEIARVILFLCSDDAKVIHGAAVPVYGAS